MHNETAVFAAPLPYTDDVPLLIARLVAEHGAQWVDQASVDGWLAQDGSGVLLIAGDPVRFPECLDVAVVLPELKRARGIPLRIGVARRDHEDALARRFGAQRRPSLICVRDGGYLGEVAGMLDWDDYVREFTAVLTRPVPRVRPIGIPVVAADASHGCH